MGGSAAGQSADTRLRTSALKPRARVEGWWGNLHFFAVVFFSIEFSFNRGEKKEKALVSLCDFEITLLRNRIVF